MTSTEFVTETSVLLNDIKNRLNRTGRWWNAIDETTYLYLVRHDDLLKETADEQLIKLWRFIALVANKEYYEQGGEFLQARASVALVMQACAKQGYTPEHMGISVTTKIGPCTTVEVSELTKLVIDEFLGNTWGPAI